MNKWKSEHQINYAKVSQDHSCRESNIEDVSGVYTVNSYPHRNRAAVHISALVQTKLDLVFISYMQR